jgi:hypothetical protein
MTISCRNVHVEETTYYLRTVRPYTATRHALPFWSDHSTADSDDCSYLSNWMAIQMYGSYTTDSDDHSRSRVNSKACSFSYEKVTRNITLFSPMLSTKLIGFPQRNYSQTWRFGLFRFFYLLSSFFNLWTPLLLPSF